MNFRDFAAMKRLTVDGSGLDAIAYRATVFFSSAGTYILLTYSFTIRRAEKRGATVRIDSLTVASQRCGTRAASRSNPGLSRMV